MASRAPSERKRVPSAPHAFPLISPNPPHCLRVGCRSAASRRVRRRTTSLNLRDCTATGRVLSFLIKIHSPSHKRVAECSCTVVHTHMSQNSKRSHALRRALSGGEHLPGRSADARGPQICDTRIHVLSTRKQNKLFVCGTLLRGGASSGPRLAFRHRWCLSPTEVCLRFERSNYGRRGVCLVLGRTSTTATMASLLLVGSLSLTWGQASGSASGSELAGTIDRVQTIDGPETRRCATMGPLLRSF